MSLLDRIAWMYQQPELFWIGVAHGVVISAVVNCLAISVQSWWHSQPAEGEAE